MSDDGEDKKDLTRIEDLSEFLHQDDPETDALLEEEDNTEEIELPSLDDLEDDDENDGSFTEAPFSSPDMDQGDFNPEEEAQEGSPSFGDDTEEPEFGASFESDHSSFDEDENEAEFGESDDTSSFDDSFSNADDSPFDEAELEEDQEPFEQELEEASFLENDEEEQAEEPQALEEAEEELEKTSEPIIEAPPSPKPIPYQQEKFQDVKEFAKSITYGTVEASGNPPYSLIIKEAVFEEDAEDILIILREHGLVNDNNEETMKQCLSGGSLLISQISEYSAIYLAHRLRRFNIELLMGLSEELHSSKSYENESKGLVSKQHLFQNKKESLSFETTPVELEDILIAVTPNLENYSIQKYIGLGTEHALINEQDLQDFQLASLSETLEEDRTPLGLNDLYDSLAEKLKVQALKQGGNAVVGVNYQLTPLISDESSQTQLLYKVTCTGNIVWVIDDGEN